MKAILKPFLESSKADGHRTVQQLKLKGGLLSDT
jgi:hypothetical protein